MSETNVKHLHDHKDSEFDILGEHVTITYRPATKDYEYSFVMTRKMPFIGHNNTFEKCKADATKCIKRLTGN